MPRINLDSNYRRFSVVGSLASGEIVVDRQEDSHNHLVEDYGRHAATRLLKHAFGKIEGTHDYIQTEIDCSDVPVRLVTRCVETTALDRIVSAQRFGRSGLSRFVLDREVEPTDHIMLVLRRDRNQLDIMQLVTAAAGRLAEPEPWDRSLTTEEAKAASLEYWANHAIIWEPDRVGSFVDLSTAREGEPTALPEQSSETFDA